MCRVIGVLLCMLIVVTGLAEEARPVVTRAHDGYFVKRCGQFSVVSDIQDNAVRLSENLGRLQHWICKRWRLPDKDLSLECRVFSLSSQAVLVGDFRINDPRVEIRKDENGKDVYAIYVVAKDSPTDNLASFVTTIILKDIERRYGMSFGHWAYRGMATLDCSYARIREKVGVVRPRMTHDKPVFFSESLFTMTEKDWRGQSSELRLLYDGEAAVLCLMLVREFGMKRFSEFLGTKCLEQDLFDVFGVKSYDALDPVLKKYLSRMPSSDNKNFQIP